MLAQFKDRTQAGRLLAQKLAAYADRPDVVVLALPRGGVPVAYEVAEALRVPFDVFPVRKLGVPGHGELAMGAIAGDGVRVINEDLVQHLGITNEQIDRVAAREQELERRGRLYRGSRPAADVRGQTVILVDDGLATGATMRAAVMALRRSRPAEIIVAAPVAAHSTCDEFRDELGTICVCALVPFHFDAVGSWYMDFAQTTDDEVRGLLERAANSEARQVA